LDRSDTTPLAVLPDPVVLSRSEPLPAAVLLLPLVFSKSVRAPVAVLALPSVFDKRDCEPRAVLSLPSEFVISVCEPTAVLLAPSIFENNDFDPTAVFKTEFVEKEAPDPLLNNAESPIATMLLRVFFFNASVPIAILLKPVETDWFARNPQAMFPFTGFNSPACMLFTRKRNGWLSVLPIN
jgi:hypothetical protein